MPRYFNIFRSTVYILVNVFWFDFILRNTFEGSSNEVDPWYRPTDDELSRMRKIVERLYDQIADDITDSFLKNDYIESLAADLSKLNKKHMWQISSIIGSFGNSDSCQRLSRGLKRARGHYGVPDFLSSSVFIHFIHFYFSFEITIFRIFNSLQSI